MKIRWLPAAVRAQRTLIDYIVTADEKLTHLPK